MITTYSRNSAFSDPLSDGYIILISSFPPLYAWFGQGIHYNHRTHLSTSLNYWKEVGLFFFFFLGKIVRQFASSVARFSITFLNWNHQFNLIFFLWQKWIIVGWIENVDSDDHGNIMKIIILSIKSRLEFTYHGYMLSLMVLLSVDSYINNGISCTNSWTN